MEKGYEIAHLNDDEIQALKSMEQQFAQMFHQDVILVAWQKNELKD